MAYSEILKYHQLSKHYFDHYAKSLGYLDWDNQPNPFRFYENKDKNRLQLMNKELEAKYIDLYDRSNNSTQKLNKESLSNFLELSLALSAWKKAGDARWSLRINPSSGNLHPTEAHLILPELDEVQSGIYHYNPLLHMLEKRAALTDNLWTELESVFNGNGFYLAFSSIFWRESWKYGERAFRYCNHDIGHALACISFSANLLGWKVHTLNDLSDEQLNKILGFDHVKWKKYEKEHPDILCYITPKDFELKKRSIPQQTIDKINSLDWQGTPNSLSDDTLEWQEIIKIHKNSLKPETKSKNFVLDTSSFFGINESPYKASEIIRKRRSAQAFDGKTSITKTQFINILDKTLARENTAPFDMKLSESHCHLLLFVHRVEDLEQGIYLFIRNSNHLDELKKLTNQAFLWDEIEKGFPLYFLHKIPFTKESKTLSCHQSIASDSAFSLGMLCKFEAVLEEEPYLYRQLFWETGIIGQILYLEAESIGLQGTGIGCFFDDPVHEILSIKDHSYQSLYHFTFGGAVNDSRLQTLRPYDHLDNIKENPDIPQS